MTTFDYIAIDGRNLLWRMHATHRSLTAKVGGEEVQTGGIYGFLASSVRIFRKFKGRVVVAWEDDRRWRNWRYNVWPQYKPRQKDGFQDVLDQEVDEQQKRLVEILSFLGVSQYRSHRGEADDVLGRLSTVSRKGKRIVLYSGDSDLLQLVTDSVRVAASSKGQEILYKPGTVIKRMGVRPELVSDLKALAGDNSDGIPGAQYVGPVAAAKLLNQYGSLEGVVVAAINGSDWPVQERMRQSILEINETGLLDKFHQLTRIRCDHPWRKIETRFDLQAAYGLLKEYKMHSLAMAPQYWTILNRMGLSQ